MEIIFSCHEKCKLHIKRSNGKYIFSSNLNCIHYNINIKHLKKYFKAKTYMDRNCNIYSTLSKLFCFIDEYFCYCIYSTTMGTIHYDIENNIGSISSDKNMIYYIFEGFLDLKLQNIVITLIDFLTNSVF